MLVVADSSPLIVLINIEHIDILPRLFVIDIRQPNDRSFKASQNSFGLCYREAQPVIVIGARADRPELN